MYDQKEYLLAYALVFSFLILGLLLVCIPRPRKSEYVDPETAAKNKAQSQRMKVGAKKKKKANKAKAKKEKARQKIAAKKKRS